MAANRRRAPDPQAKLVATDLKSYDGRGRPQAETVQIGGLTDGPFTWHVGQSTRDCIKSRRLRSRLDWRSHPPPPITPLKRRRDAVERNE